MKKYILLPILFCLFSSTSFAATISVAFQNDEYSDNEDCSLREAITNTNNDTNTFDECVPVGIYGDDTITLEDGITYYLQELGSDEDSNLSGDLDITGNLTISSPGTSIIDADELSGFLAPDRIFDSRGSSKTITLSGLTLQYGRIDIGASNDGGAVIRMNSGTLNITDCNLSNNTIYSDSSGSVLGGMIRFTNASSSSHLYISNSSISNNFVSVDGASTSDVNGGLIYFNNLGASSITNSNFNENSINPNGRVEGGLFAILSTDSLDIINSNFNNNSVYPDDSIYSRGGVFEIVESNITISGSSFLGNVYQSSDAGITGNIRFSSNSANTLTILNSTFADNQINNTSTFEAYGGALEISGSNPVAQISFSTFVNNSATADSAQGGALYIANSGGSLTLKSNIIANNTTTGTSALGPNCFTTSIPPISANYNVIEDTANCNFTPEENDGIGVDPTLDLIATNLGGPTDVYAFEISIGSDIDATCLDASETLVTTDQRGAPRYDGFCDAGAYERGSFCPDSDADGYGVPLGCSNLYVAGYATNSDDCDDAIASTNPGATELCDDVNNDCDAETDEDFTTLSDACSAGVGECASAGVMVCNATLDDVMCNATAGLPTDELCGDTLDNDCDGNTDEGFEDLGLACSEGVGACENTGVYECATDLLSLECSVSAGDASAEVCDDESDNDCDGDTDSDDADCTISGDDDDDTTGDDDDDTTGDDDDDDDITDTDGDGIADSVDNCPDDSNANQLDSDADGIGNECESTATASSGGCQLSGTSTPKESGLILVLVVAAGWLAMRNRKAVTEM